MELETVNQTNELFHYLSYHYSLYSLGTLIAQFLPERTGKQCRERFHNHLDNGIKKGDWTPEVNHSLSNNLISSIYLCIFLGG